MSPFWLEVRDSGAFGSAVGGLQAGSGWGFPPSRVWSHEPWMLQGIARPSGGRSGACGRACVLRLAPEETVPTSVRRPASVERGLDAIGQDDGEIASVIAFERSPTA